MVVEENRRRSKRTQLLTRIDRFEAGTHEHEEGEERDENSGSRRKSRHKCRLKDDCYVCGGDCYVCEVVVAQKRKYAIRKITVDCAAGS